MFETIDRSIIVELEAQLGPTLVAMLAGSRDKYIVEKWLSDKVETQVKPTPDEVRRLSYAFEQYKRVAAVQGNDLARQWFIGNNVRGGLSPACAIRDDDFEGVRASASDFINDAWS